MSNRNASKDYITKPQAEVRTLRCPFEIRQVYVRFVTTLKSKKSHQSLGVIRAAGLLNDRGRFNKEDKEELEELFGWFNDFLAIPQRLSKSSKPRAECKAISWFRDSANLHIRKIREIADVLERNNIQIEMLTSKTLGYIVYEDEHQVIAIPFQDSI